jgi:hypothetical protein
VEPDKPLVIPDEIRVQFRLGASECTVVAANMGDCLGLSLVMIEPFDSKILGAPTQSLRVRDVTRHAAPLLSKVVPAYRSYAELAYWYRTAVAFDISPLRIIADRYTISTSTAQNDVWRARAQGYLGPTKQGRAGG